MPVVAAAFFRQVNELNDATGFYILRLSKLVAQRKDRRQKYHERQKNLTGSICRCCDGLLCQRARGWCCAHLVSAAVAAVARPVICFLAFLRPGEGQRVAQLPAGRSFDTAKGKGRPPRGSSRCRWPGGSLKWSVMRSRRPWSLGVRAALTHVFAIARPAGSSAMCQPQDHG
jgi:hypothetical protein